MTESGYRDETDIRVRRALEETWREGMEAAAIAPPLDDGRPLFTRDYSVSVLNKALTVTELGMRDKYEEAYREVLENCRMYREDKVLRDDCDNFYWSADLVIFFYNRHLRSGQNDGDSELLRELRQEILAMMWIWVYDNSVITETEYRQSKTWYVWGSENHHVQKYSAVWGFLSILRGEEEYRHRVLEDGFGLEEHFQAWSAYAREWIRERGRKGLFVESSNGNYNGETLKGISVIFRYAEDPELRRLAGQLFDLYWASWSIEQLGGVRGGAKSRIYPKRGIRGEDTFLRLAWYYLGMGEERRIQGNDLSFLLSDYRLPAVVRELALRTEERGCYENCQRILGLAADGCYQPMWYHLDTEYGGLVRYTYCTPRFIMGSYHMEPRPSRDWTMISSQNRFQGVIFSNHRDARVVVQCVPNIEKFASGIERSYNQFWGVQSKGSLITAKLPTSEGSGQMRIWYHASCQEDMVVSGNRIYTRNTQAGCFIALWVVEGAFSWMEGTGAEEGCPGKTKGTEEGCLRTAEDVGNGRFLMVEDEKTPIVLEIVPEEMFESYERFQETCEKEGRRAVRGKGSLTCRSVYGDSLSFHDDCSALPEINGREIDLRPDYAFYSPYLREAWNSGEADIIFGGKRLHLSF